MVSGGFLGSRITCGTHLRRSGSFCEHVNKEPDQLLKMKDKFLSEIMTDYVSDMEHQGKAGSYIKSTIKADLSWLTFNGTNLQRNIKVKDAGDTPTLRNERGPGQKELKGILSAGNLRSQVTVSLMAFSGLRLCVIGKYKGTEGVRMSDLPDLKIENGDVFFRGVPAKITVRKQGVLQIADPDNSRIFPE